MKKVRRSFFFDLPLILFLINTFVLCALIVTYVAISTYPYEIGSSHGTYIIYAPRQYIGPYAWELGDILRLFFRFFVLSGLVLGLIYILSGIVIYIIRKRKKQKKNVSGSSIKRLILLGVIGICITVFISVLAVGFIQTIFFSPGFIRYMEGSHLF